MKLRYLAWVIWAILVLFMVLPLTLASFGQPLTQNAVSEKECWSAAQGPGGPSQWLCINTVRNGSKLVIKSGSGAATSTAEGGTLRWSGTAPTTWTITLPSPAFDGQQVVISTDTTLTTMVTVNAGAGQTLNATYTSQTLTAFTTVEFQYRSSTAVWYRLR